MLRPCDTCGSPYEARSKRSRFCSNVCRAKNKGRPKTERQAEAIVSAFFGTGGRDTEVVEAIRAELVAADLAESYLGRTALTLAAALSQPDTGSAKASLSRELRTVMDELLSRARRVESSTDGTRDELAARRAMRVAR